MFRDSRGLYVTASSADSVQRLDEAVSAYLGARRDTLSRAENLAADPDCVLAHVFFGYLLMHACKLESAAQAKETLAWAHAASERTGATQRERLHVDALEAWICGEHFLALERWEAILYDHPLDILALRLAQFMISYLGNSAQIRDSVARVRPAWNEGTPGFGYVLGCYAYGLEEAGEYSQAERFGRMAVERNPCDLWAAHAVTHVMEMDGHPRSGISWLDTMQPYWSVCNNFVLHLAWHRCLFHLALAEYDAVLDLYDRQVRSQSTDEYLDIANAVSLLWRLEQANVNVGSRWSELAARASSRTRDHFFVFADLHYLVALAAVDSVGADRCLSSCRSFARSEQGTQSRIMHDVGLSVAHAFLCHRRGAYAEAFTLLQPVRTEFRRIGGSHTQRDLFDHLLIDSAVRSGQSGPAHALLIQRAENRPRDLWNWRSLAAFLDDQKDVAGARAALARVNQLLKEPPAVNRSAPQMGERS
jgi:tetratricopeptide (TPR) repeat protein